MLPILRRFLFVVLLALGLAACKASGPSPLPADVIVDSVFARLCSPFRAQMAVTVRETAGDSTVTITLLEITMTDINGVQRYHRALSASDISGLVGTNVVAAGAALTVTVESAYPGNVDTQDSTGRVILSAVDALGNAIASTTNNIFQRDRC